MFPLKVTIVGSMNLVIKEQEGSMFWHMRCHHLNAKELRLMKLKQMVQALHDTEQLDHYEACVLAKQSKRSFSTGKS